MYLNEEYLGLKVPRAIRAQVYIKEVHGPLRVWDPSSLPPPPYPARRPPTRILDPKLRAPKPETLNPNP